MLSFSSRALCQKRCWRRKGLFLAGSDVFLLACSSWLCSSREPADWETSSFPCHPSGLVHSKFWGVAPPPTVSGFARHPEHRFLASSRGRISKFIEPSTSRMSLSFDESWPCLFQEGLDPGPGLRVRATKEGTLPWVLSLNHSGSDCLNQSRLLWQTITDWVA